MNILCEFEVPFKGEIKKCKLTMRSLIRAQSELNMSGIKELGEALENLNVVAGYAIIAACLDPSLVIISNGFINTFLFLILSMCLSMQLIILHLLPLNSFLLLLVLLLLFYLFSFCNNFSQFLFHYLSHHFDIH